MNTVFLGKQVSDMMIAANAMQLCGEFPHTADAMGRFLKYTFPGSKPNRNEVSTLGLRTEAPAQRPINAEIPATGAGSINHAGSNPAAQSDECNATGSGTRGLKLPRSDNFSERTEEAKGRPDARDQLRAERLATA